MKKMYKLKQSFKLLAMVIFIGWAGTLSAQLSGAYTIDNGSATAGTNFNTFTDFKTAIVANGVNGAVTVQFLTNQTESTQAVFPAIAGATATNSITIDGNGKYLSMAMTSEIISMNGAAFFTFKNLTLTNTSTSTTVQGFRFYNGANNNTVDKCTIEFSALTSSNTNGGAYVAFASSATSLTTTSTVDNGINNTISNNLMRTTNVNSPGPAFGIVITGSSSNYTSVAQNNTIKDNIIQNFYYMGVYQYYTNGNQILNNNISRTNATSYNCNSTLYGIYSYYSKSSTRSSKLDGNNLNNWPFSGATTSGGNSTTFAFYTYFNDGNATYRFTMSGNTITKLRVAGVIYLGYNYYNKYFDMNNNMADDNDVTVSSSSAQMFYGYQNWYNQAYNYNGNTIKNCDGGYYFYGIKNSNPQTLTGVSTSISGNSLTNNLNSYYYFQGIMSVNNYNSNTSFININDNTVSNNSCAYYSFTGISSFDYASYTYSWGYTNFQRNKINQNTCVGYSYANFYGIYAYYDYDINVTDNMIADNNCYYYSYGMQLYSFNSGGYTANVRQNTQKWDGNLNANFYKYLFCLYDYMYYHTSKIEGNITEVKNYYYAYMLYCPSSTATNIQIKNNSYYTVSNSNNYWYDGSTTYYSGPAYLAATSAPGEKFGDPKWNNASTLDLKSNTLINQNNIAYNALDIKDANQVLRNTAKNDRGALEGYLDIANQSSTFAPNTNECSGYIMNPTVTLKNNFSEAITGFMMGVSSNGVLLGTSTVTNTIAIGGTGTVVINPIKFSKAGPQKVKIFLLDADDNATNDTLTYNFNIKQSPGGGVISLNTALSAPKATFDITGKPDVTASGEKIVYNMTAPSRVGYTNADNLFNGGNKWFLGITGVTKYGKVVPSADLVITNPSGSTDGYVTLNPSAPFIDSLITLTFKVIDVASGCDTLYTRKVQIAPKGVPDFKLPSIICDKDEVFFENTSTVSSGALLSTWDFGDGSPTVDATSPVYKYNGPGTYTVKLTVVTSPYGYVTSKSVVINVNEIPTANFKPTNACAGTAVKLTNTTTIGSGTLTYVWDYGDGSPTSTAINTTKLYAAPGGYKVTLSASGNGCVNAITKNVYQFARPVADFSNTAGTCENDVFEFSNGSTIALGEFGNNWDFDDGGNKATVTDPKYDFLTPGVKNVKLTVVSEFGCTDFKVIPITVKTIATTGFTAPFACSRTATQFTNTTNLNGETLKGYLWDFGDGYTSTATAPIHSWSSIGPKIVKLQTTLVGGCMSEVSEILNVGVQPEVNFQFADQCAGSEVQFTNLTSFTQGNIVYAWDFGDASGSAQGSPKHTYSTGVGTQTFTVILRAGIVGGCKDSAVKTININPLPTTCDFDYARDYTTSLTAYKYTPKGGALSGIDYTWLTGDGASLTSAGAGATYAYSNSGKYCVTMIAKNNTSGCECSKTNCLSLSLDIDKAASLKNAISIYPNPTNGIFNVKIDANINGNMTVNVYNILGSLVKTVTVDSNNANIDLSGFANSVYTVKVIADNQTVTKQIVLNK